MNSYRLVVVAKGSKKGEKAMEKAVEIAKEQGIDTIHLLFVNDINFFSGGGISYLEEDLRKSLRNIGDAILRKLEKTAKKIDPNIKVKMIELEGNTAEEILKFVKENSVETIIIPKEKRGPIEKSIINGYIEPSFFKEIGKRSTLIVVK